MDQKKKLIQQSLGRLKQFLERNIPMNNDDSPSADEYSSESESDVLSPRVLRDKLSIVDYIPAEFTDLHKQYQDLLKQYAPYYPHVEIFRERMITGGGISRANG